MKTITAFLLMTSVAHAQVSCSPSPCPPNCTPSFCQATGGSQSFSVTSPPLERKWDCGRCDSPEVQRALDQIRKNTLEPCINGRCDSPEAQKALKEILDAMYKASSTPIPSGSNDNTKSYTLVLRDKRGVTMLIRGKARESSVAAVTVCNAVADNLKESADIESAECFK